MSLLLHVAWLVQPPGRGEVRSKTFEGWSRSQSVKTRNPTTMFTSPGLWNPKLGGLGCTRFTVLQFVVTQSNARAWTSCFASPPGLSETSYLFGV